MLDVVLMGAILVFFLLSWAYVAGAERL